MLSPENPYMLPSVLVAAVAYLAVTLLTDASLLVRIGTLVLLAGVLPVVLNLLFGGGSAENGYEESLEESAADGTEETSDAGDADESHGA
jgi:hypothetical protein